ncbi:MAG: diguanylate cyclase [Chloroflexi bacterium]|nr:diguanylate cyclase [Chloroflexota bacterium]
MQKHQYVWGTITSYSLGAISLSVFSSFQKSLLGLPFSLELKAFVVPIFFGGLSGIAIYLSNLRLRTSRERMRDFINNVEDIIQIVDTKGNFRFVNNAWLETFGYTKLESKRLSVFDIVHPDDLKHYTTIFQSLVRKEIDKAQIKAAFLTKEGKTIYLKGSVNLQLKGNVPVSTRSIFRNITEERESRYLRKLAENIFSNTKEGIVATDQKGQIKFTNNAFLKITEHSEEELYKKNISAVFPLTSPDSEVAIQMGSALREFGIWKGELWAHKKNGMPYLLRMSVNAIENEEGETVNYAGIVTDITQDKERERNLYNLAMYDNLTKLPNREMFYEFASIAQKEAEEKNIFFALLFLDLDNFKEINDKHGHLIGDRLLKALSQRLRNATRGSDIASRFGGDEFVILLNNIKTIENTKKVSLHILNSISKPFIINKKKLYISASIGISFYSYKAEIEELLKNADKAMYKAKQDGKNRIQLSLRTETRPISKDDLQ